MSIEGNYSANLPSGASFKQISNDPQKVLRYRVSNLMDAFFDSAMNKASDGSFKAVVLSGIRTEDNTGAGIDVFDGRKVGDYLKVVVRPLTPFGEILPDPSFGSKNSEEVAELIALHANMFTARSDFNYDAAQVPKFGQIVNCYYEQGSIRAC